MSAKKTPKKVTHKKITAKKSIKTNPLSLTDNKYLVIMLMVCAFIPLGMILQVFFSNFRTIQRSMPEVFVGEEKYVFGSAIRMNTVSTPDTYILVNNSGSINAHKGFTAEMWIRPFNRDNFSDIIFAKSGNYRIGMRGSVLDNTVMNTVISFSIADSGLNGYRTVEKQLEIPLDKFPTWHHIAVVVQDDGTMNIFFDGSINTSNTNSIANIANSSNELIIGGQEYSNGQKGATYSGDMDEIRVSNIARYTSNFTVSKTPFVTDLNTTLLMHLDSNLDDSSGIGYNGSVVGYIEYITSDIVFPVITPTLLPTPVVCAKGMVYPHYKNIKGVCTLVD